MLVASVLEEKHLRAASWLPFSTEEAEGATGRGAERPRGALDGKPCHSVKMTQAT